VHKATIFPLIANDNIKFAIIHEFGSVYDLAVSEVSFAFCLDNVIGDVESDFSTDYTPSCVVELCLTHHRTDFVAKKFCSAG